MNHLALLLSDPSVSLRLRVLKEILRLESNDPEIIECRELQSEDPILRNLISLQHDNGSWTRLSSRYPFDFDATIATAQALRTINLLGFGSDFPPAARAIEFLFCRQEEDGSWPLSQESDAPEAGHYTSVSLQTSLPLQGLAAIGIATDPRCEKAYQWLLDQRLDDGTWPTGRAGKVLGYVAGYRRLAQSKWGCRSNTTSALVCLSMHPELKNSETAERGLDHLLGRQSREKKPLGYDLARLLGRVPLRGFFTFYDRFDLLLLLKLCGEIGANDNDPRVESVLEFFAKTQSPFGLWLAESFPELRNWISLEILLAMEKIGGNRNWFASSAATPFTPYPRPEKRY